MITSVWLSPGGRELGEIWMAHDWHMTALDSLNSLRYLLYSVSLIT